jgi:apolipoprotein N-acyltransferase
MVFEDGGRRRADVFLNITNDGWFTGTPEQVMHLMIAGLRCVECRTPMARSVNTGISAIIDSSGRVTRALEVGGKRQGVEGSLLGEVKLDDRTPPFAVVGTWPAALGAGLTLALSVAGGWRLRRAGRASSSGLASGAGSGPVPPGGTEGSPAGGSEGGKKA